jgi:hypothetical protein
MTREIIAAVIDPITGVNRFIDRDALKVVEKPAMYVPSALVAAFDVGVLWRGENLSFLDADGEPFLQANVGYGTLSQGRSKLPFDAFGVSMRMGGGGSAISELRVRGRLLGVPLGGDPETPTRRSLHFMTVGSAGQQPACQFGGRTSRGRSPANGASRGVAPRDERQRNSGARRNRLRVHQRSRPAMTSGRAQLRQAWRS